MGGGRALQRVEQSSHTRREQALWFPGLSSLVTQLIPILFLVAFSSAHYYSCPRLQPPHKPIRMHMIEPYGPDEYACAQVGASFTTTGPSRPQGPPCDQSLKTSPGAIAHRAHRLGPAQEGQPPESPETVGAEP